ncbi:hypothetical protein K2173_021964 [Erythroxylum novogranatense]|uniref:UDP-3-O-acyl-N-acetylglucosamine deacetylase n=1 Tax=Erythroxylum novogranatense TaxID=1862640 RepID=A0AAV8T2E1_9ROSI|nr:hypothetical protein K2173_021964 [Erythroxylum novogranatense]
MSLSAALRSSNLLVSWKSTGRFQQTIAACVELSGKGLHSGKLSTVRICPELAGKGRFFDSHSISIPASIDFVQHSPLSTSLFKDGVRIRTVEHLLSTLEAIGVDNCRIQIHNHSDSHDYDVEVPILDGSARQWAEAIEKVGLTAAADEHGQNCEKLAPYLNEPVYVWKNDAFVAAFPSPKVQITYGIDFPQAPTIGRQWVFVTPLEDSCYVKQISSSRTFCLFEEAEYMRERGLIKGGSLDNAIVCSATNGWLNPPLHFYDEPCRHKVLDLIGDLSLFARFGNQGLPVAHIVAYKGSCRSFLNIYGNIRNSNRENVI